MRERFSPAYVRYACGRMEKHLIVGIVVQSELKVFVLCSRIGGVTSCLLMASVSCSSHYFVKACELICPFFLSVLNINEKTN